MIGVMQLVHSLSAGGTERLVIQICRRLSGRFRMTVCCLDEPGAWADEVRHAGIEVAALNRRPGFRPSLGPRIASLMRHHGSAVVHCHQYSPFVYGRLAQLQIPGARMIFTEHGRPTADPPSRKRRLANAFLAPWPAGIYAVSGELRRHMIAEGFPPGRIQVVNNGIELGELPSRDDRRAARQLLGLDPDAFVVGTVGRLDPVKDLPTLIDAFAIAKQRVGQAVLVIVGDGPERDRLEAHARSLALGGAILFTGLRTDARRLLAALDVYANSSTTEGVSLSILEAMAAGLPIIATKVGGTPEVVLQDATGLLVDPESPQAVAAAIEALAIAPARRLAMGRSGRERVERSFVLDDMIERYARAYSGEEVN
jgi:glycosyltransferase involved in cell wall biosynthesis